MANADAQGYNSCVEEFRDREYPMLKDSVYLDHAGSTLYSKSLIDNFANSMMSNLLGNPHSASSSSQYTTSRIEDVRVKLLRFFNADPAQFDLVFVANATAGIKLVSEAFRALPEGFSFAYHEACHTSIVGVREEARRSECVTDAQIQGWVSGEALCLGHNESSPDVLFSYTAQSHMDGKRYPLTWPALLRQQFTSPCGQLYIMLDAASLAATSQLDLSNSDSAPDFTVLSLYKIFGFPDLGALIVRRRAESVFNHKRYFGGGTVDMVVCSGERWHAPKTMFLHERLEDGTLPFHSILAVDDALDVHAKLFVSMNRVAMHTAFLTRRLYQGLNTLRHGNGHPVCTIYSQWDNDEAGSCNSGPVISFNIRNSAGTWVSLHEFEKLATLKNLHIRTGGVCSPGGIASALGLKPWEMRRNFSSGFRCGTEEDIIAGKPTGIIRASLGAMSTISDVDYLVAFVNEFYREIGVSRVEPVGSLSNTPSGLQVLGINVYPIKSCGNYAVPLDMAWEVRPEGLAWDREWCLVHQGSGQALSQKRYPKMALIKPILDFERGVLHVSYRGKMPPHLLDKVTVPLSAHPAHFDTILSTCARPSHVCGDEVTVQIYASSAINSFFSDILGVPCALARFPAGGQGLGMRHSKAKIQNHQHATVTTPRLYSVSLPELLSPTESDSEQPARKILLSNESPILLINTASLQALNDEIEINGGRRVASDVFRANVIVGNAASASQQIPWAEDTWTSLSVGGTRFRLLGSCRRCQMVCIDQDNGERHNEPFLTLTKVRRFDGKVYFGNHMGYEPPIDSAAQQLLLPTIRVGDSVHVDNII